MGTSPISISVLKIDKPPRQRLCIPLSLRFFVGFLTICIAAGGWICIRAYCQSCALQELKRYAKVDGARIFGPDWLRRLVTQERMQAFDEIQSIVFNPDQERSLQQLLFRSGFAGDRTVEQVVDSDSLICVRKFPDLKRLDLTATNIADPGIEHVCSLQNLEILYLDGTAVSDRGVRLLKQLPRLKRLSLRRVYVTKELVAELEAARPALKIDL